MTDTVLDIDLDSLVDMNIAPQCEHQAHSTDHVGEDASYVVSYRTDCGHRNRNLLMCEYGLRPHSFLCTVCCTKYLSTEVIKIIGKL